MELVINNLASFLDFVRPPAAMHLTYCIGTTYSLNLECLVQVALNSQSRFDTSRGLPPHEVFEILRSFTDAAVVFCQSCQIKNIVDAENPQIMPNMQKLYSILDDAVRAVPCSITRSGIGSFHPKVWLLRYDNAEAGAEPLFRLMVMSRNLTMDLSWDVAATLHGTLVTRAHNGNDMLSKFLETLRKSLPAKDARDSLLSTAIDDLKRVTFVSPFRGKDAPDFAFQWPGVAALPFKRLQAYDDLIVVSPFLKSSTVSDLAANKRTFKLVTGSANLDQLDRHVDLLPNVYLMRSDGMEPHAKIYIGRNRDKAITDVWIGSANCTVSGLQGLNAEAMVRLQAPKAFFQAFIDGFVFSGKDGSLSPWLQEVTESDARAVSEEPTDAERQAVDKARRVIGSGTFRIDYIEKTSTATLRFALPAGAQIPPLANGLVRPLVREESVALQHLVEGKVLRWDTPISELSCFVVIEVGCGACRESFWTIAQGKFDRASRRARQIRKLVKSWSDFLDYLNAMLGIQTPTPTSGKPRPPSSPQRHRDGDNESAALDFRTEVLERLLLESTLDRALIERIEIGLAGLSPKDVDGDLRYYQFLKLWSQLRKSLGPLGKAGKR